MRKILIPIVALCLTVWTAPISADSSTRNDADESPGGLDIASATHRHGGRGVYLHEISMYEPWSNDILFDHSTDFQLALEYGPDFRTFRYIVIDVQEDGSLYGEINHPIKQNVVGYVKVWRSDDRSLVVAFPKQALAKRLPVYHWAFSSGFHDDSVPECSQDDGHIITCVDAIPNQGWIRHRLRK